MIWPILWTKQTSDKMAAFSNCYVDVDFVTVVPNVDIVDCDTEKITRCSAFLIPILIKKQSLLLRILNYFITAFFRKSTYLL